LLNFDDINNNALHFFFKCRENHQQSLINHIMSIMTHILNEETSQTVLDVILRNLVKEGKVSGLCYL
jgi:sister-chromatid-cohesion protein PDS5